MQVTTEARILRAMPAVALGLDYRPALLTGSGIARAVRELCRALARHGREVDVHLFGHSLARARRDEPIPPQCRLHRLPIPGRSLPLLARLGLDPARLWGGVELFHWTDYIHPPLNQGMAVLTLHDLAFAADPSYHGREQSQVPLERCRRVAKRSRMVVTPTRATAEMARLHLQVEAEKLQVIPFGCDHVPDDRGPHPLGGRPYIPALGTIEPRKNHLLLLEAWRRLLPPRPALVVIGRRGWECDATAVPQRRGSPFRGDVSCGFRAFCSRHADRWTAIVCQARESRSGRARAGIHTPGLDISASLKISSLSVKSSTMKQLPIFRSEGQARVLARLFLGPGQSFKLIELQEATGLSAGAVHREVERLEHAGLLRSERVGRTRLVRPDPASPFYPELRSLIVKVFGPVPLLREALGGLSSVEEAFIFGSWAALALGSGERPPRDVDVMIIGSPDLDLVYEASRRVERQIGLPVNPTVMTQAEWDADESGFAAAVKAGPRVHVLGHGDA